MTDNDACRSCVPSQNIARRKAIRSCSGRESCPYGDICPFIGITGCESMRLIVPLFLTLEGVSFEFIDGVRKTTLKTDAGIVDGVCARAGIPVTAVIPLGSDLLRMIVLRKKVGEEEVVFLR